MRFSDEEIDIARRLRAKGLTWEPAPGHYVFDETGFCKQSSPFQEKVYFILNYPYFIRTVGGLERFKEIMMWLPTWPQIRTSLNDLGISNQQLANHIAETRAIESGTERLTLYKLAESVLEGNAELAAASGE